MSPLWRHPKKPPHAKRRKNFFSLNYKTCWISRGFEQLPSSIDWRVIVLQSSIKTVALAGLEGKTPSTCGYRLRESTLYAKCYDPQEPFKRQSFFSLAVFWFYFGTLKDPNKFLAFLVPRLGSKNIQINCGNPQKILRKAPHQLTVFWPNFWTRNARNSIKGSKNAHSGLESENTVSQNIGAWDRMMTSSN